MLRWIGGHLAKLCAWIVTLAVPLFAVWIASSLAAYRLGMPELAAGAGLLLFPVLPLAWDLIGEVRRRRRGDERERILTRSDRILVRTFVLSSLFLGTMLLALPREAFEATSARGDWFLDSARGTWVEPVRDGLHRGAMGLEWLYEWASENRWDELVDDDVQLAEDVEAPAPAPRDAGPTATSGEAAPTERVAGRVYVGDALWRLEPVLHPAATSVPAASLQSIDGVAQWLREHAVGDADLAKAVHDFVAVHVDYDAPALAAGQYPPQDAQTVFDTGTGVCAGYANLFATLAKAAGLEALYVVGDSRSAITGEVADVGHAWNVVRIDGAWQLVDATWNAGTVDEDRFEERYRTDYLFTPPRVFGETHFPDSSAWQLLGDDAIDRATFVGQLVATPAFHAAGLSYVAPLRSPLEVGRRVEIHLANPDRRSIWVRIARDSSDRGQDCGRPSDAANAVFHCDVPSGGAWQVSTLIEEEENVYYGASVIRVIR